MLLRTSFKHFFVLSLLRTRPQTRQIIKMSEMNCLVTPFSSVYHWREFTIQKLNMELQSAIGEVLMQIFYFPPTVVSRHHFTVTALIVWEHASTWLFRSFPFYNSNALKGDVQCSQSLLDSFKQEMDIAFTSYRGWQVQQLNKTISPFPIAVVALRKTIYAAWE